MGGKAGIELRVLLSRRGRAALSLPFAASVCLALAGLGAPAEGSYGVWRGSGGPHLVTLDPEGNRNSIQTPKGPTTTTLHDELGKPLTVTQPKPSPEAPANPVTTFRYDENRNLIRMEDADGRVTKLDYDELNRLFKTTRDPGALDLTTTTTEFDEDGHPLRIAEANGEVTRQTWDELGRLSTRKHEAPATAWTAPWAYTTDERYFYDPNSNLERIEETDVRKDGSTPPERVTRRGYDKLDRQTSETVTLQDRTTSSVTTEYYRDGRVKSVTDPRGATSYTYDGQGREETVTTSGGVTRKTYYPDGLVKDITFPNLTKRAQDYDKADRLRSIVTTAGDAAVASTAYTYDSNGNRLTQVQTNGGSEEATGYTYDDVDRLATVTYAPDAGHPNGRKVTYGHDGAGNRKTEVVTDPQTEAVLESKTGHFDDANRLTELTDNLDAAQTTTLVWDKNGNLLSETKAGVTTTYRYDLRDTLAEVERGGQPLVRFLGDFNERRILKIGDPTRPEGSGAQEYLYNGSRLVLDVENGQPVSRYEWTNEELVSLLENGGQRRYFALDGLETVLALTDEAGLATDRLSFDTWGVPNEGTDFGTTGNRFAFTSHRFDTELDLYYAGGRMYSPTIGRFISQDTLGLDPNNPDTWNLFSYARSNPTRYVDPTGHVSDEVYEKAIYAAEYVYGFTSAYVENFTGGLVARHDPYFASDAELRGQLLGDRISQAQAAFELVQGGMTLGTGAGGGTLLLATGVGAPLAVPAAGVAAIGALEMGHGVMMGKTAIENQAKVQRELEGREGKVVKESPTREAAAPEPRKPADANGKTTLEPAQADPKPASPEVGPTEPYNRKKHYGRTPSSADRRAVGAGAEDVADHDPPLVKRYYEGDPATGEKPGHLMTEAERRASGSDRSRMAPQPRPESNRQGGEMSKYSKEQKAKHFSQGAETQPAPPQTETPKPRTEDPKKKRS
jgi:RHS repeat-associated protein